MDFIMNKIIEKVSKLTKQERCFFYIFLNENKELDDCFLNILNKSDSESLQRFLVGDQYNFETWNRCIKEANVMSEVQIEQLSPQLERNIDNINSIVKEKTKIIETNNEQALKNRNILKAGNFSKSCLYNDKTLGKQIPIKQKDYDNNSIIVDLPEFSEDVVIKKNIFDCIKDRKSRRTYVDEPLFLEELSYLLWATQGLHNIEDNNSKRTVPSASREHTFETYLVANKIEGLKKGVYRYLPFEHKLLYLFTPDGLEEKVKEASLVNDFVKNCAVYFIWSTIPYRSEWYYTTDATKFIALDAGHLCQNLYLAAESINCGTVAIGAYNQNKMDELLNLDGLNEFVIYAAPVGKVSV
jgi:SagB-type dehydrogenase family enzyme